MRAARVTAFGPLQGLQATSEHPPPSVVPGRLLVRVKAAGLNPIDWKMALGEIGRLRAKSLPFTAGTDFAGTVEAVGDGVTGFAAGDPVYGMAGIQRGGSGSCAELALADPRFVGTKPANVTFEEAAGVPMTGLRAWSVLHDWLRIQRGERVLIHGGAGGLGTFAIQVAKHLGAHVATTVGARDVEFVKSLGASVVVDYATQDFTKMFSDMDAVFDTVGGETFTRSFQVLKRGGRIATMLGQAPADLAKQAGVTVVDQAESVTPRSFAALNELLGRGIVRTVIDRVFPLEETGAALEHLRTGHPRGKVIVAI